MKLEDQVCSLEYAKRLKELGVNQESLFYWDWHSDTCYSVKFSPYSCPGLERYSAFTVSELGELIPLFWDSGKRDNKDYICRFFGKNVTNVLHSFGESEADSRAKMLIHIIENKLVEVT